MGDIRYDSTFAFRIAAAKKIVRYNGRICQSCHKVYPSRELNCPFCNGRAAPKRRRKPQALKASPSAPRPIPKSDMALCGHCRNHMPISALAGHLLRKHGTTLNVDPRPRKPRKEEPVKPATSVDGRPRITRDIEELEHRPLKDVIPKVVGPKPPPAGLQSAAPAKRKDAPSREPNPHEEQIRAELGHSTYKALGGRFLVSALCKSLRVEPRFVWRVLWEYHRELLEDRNAP